MQDDDMEKAMPNGEYTIVEVIGHRTIVGRISEVERFGTKLMSIEPIFGGTLLDPVFIGGSSIYQLTPCTAEIAMKRAPKHTYQLPASIAVRLPDEEPAMLPSFITDDELDDDYDPA